MIAILTHHIWRNITCNCDIVHVHVISRAPRHYEILIVGFAEFANRYPLSLGSEYWKWLP